MITWQKQRDAVQLERDAEDAERAQWTLDALGTRALTFTVEAEIVVHSREGDGTLEASLPPIGALSRRPRSSAPWADVDSFGDAGGAHRWSDARWDRFLQVWGATLTEASLDALKAQLARPAAARRTAYGLGRARNLPHRSQICGIRLGSRTQPSPRGPNAGRPPPGRPGGGQRQRSQSSLELLIPPLITDRPACSVRSFRSV